MKILVEVKFARQPKPIEKLANGSYVVMTNKKPKNNEANDDIVMQISKYFGVAKSSVEIVVGKTTKKKIINIAAKT